MVVGVVPALLMRLERMTIKSNPNGYAGRAPVRTFFVIL